MSALRLASTPKCARSRACLPVEFRGRRRTERARARRPTGTQTCLHLRALCAAVARPSPPRPAPAHPRARPQRRTPPAFRISARVRCAPQSPGSARLATERRHSPGSGAPPTGRAVRAAPRGIPPRTPRRWSWGWQATTPRSRPPTRRSPRSSGWRRGPRARRARRAAAWVPSAASGGAHAARNRHSARHTNSRQEERAQE